MPTIFSHAVVGSSIASLPRGNGRKVLIIAGVLAALPDIDALGFYAGIPYYEHFGHRGFTHSLTFSALAALVACAFLGRRWRLFPIFFLAAASHPLLDMLTNGGLGCALMAPYSWKRLFFPRRPIPVSPIGMSPRLVRVLLWEILILWPLGAAAWGARKRKPAIIVLSLAFSAAAICLRLW